MVLFYTLKTMKTTITNKEAKNLGDSGRDGDGVGEGRRRHRQSLYRQQKLLLRPSFPFSKPP